ncbi:MAG: tripartite tricarboxylate transporter TctB family protein [Thermodesulfobacteriota bacterium]
MIGVCLLISTRWEIDTSVPYPFYKGPLIFPLLVLILMIIASLPSAWRLLKSSKQKSWQLDGQGVPIKPLIIFSLLILYGIGLVVFGLEFSSYLFLSISLYYLGHRNLFRYIIIPLVYTVVIVFLFKYALGIYFPKPLILVWFLE